MATRQYVGARYVPIFDGDWDNSKAYDPLVIVSYQGNSYTSRTFTPAGIDISNTTYWALTGNYNAQVEAYRQEVLSYQESVESMEKLTDSCINVKDFGALGDGSNDDTNEIQLALDEAKRTNKILVFPYGTYCISEGLLFEMTEAQPLYIEGCNSTIKAIDTMTSMFTISANLQSWIKNLTFDCNGLANIGLNIVTLIHSYVLNVTVTKFLTHGFKLGNVGYDANLFNCLAWQPAVDTAIGFYSEMNDGTFNRCCASYCKYGIISKGINNILEACHVYSKNDPDDDSKNGVAFSFASTSFLTDCCSDGYRTGIEILADSGSIMVENFHYFPVHIWSADDKNCVVYIPDTYNSVEVHINNSVLLATADKRLSNLDIINKRYWARNCKLGNFADLDAFYAIFTGSSFPTAFSDINNYNFRITDDVIHFDLQGVAKYVFSSFAWSFGGTLSNINVGLSSLHAYSNASGYPIGGAYLTTSGGTAYVTPEQDKAFGVSGIIRPLVGYHIAIS